MVKLVYTKQEMQNDKFIVWGNTDSDGKFHKDHVSMVYENSVPKNRLSRFKVIFYLLFNKRLKWWIEDCIKYSLMHSDSYRGSGCTDVMPFNISKIFDRLWKKYKD